VHDHAIEPIGVMRQTDIALGRFSGRAGHHHHHGPGGHDPVGNRLLDVLQRFARKQRPRGIGMGKAGREANF